MKSNFKKKKEKKENQKDHLSFNRGLSSNRYLEKKKSAIRVRNNSYTKININ